MISFRSMPRPALFALLALFGLAGCLAAHLWRTRQDVRIVSPLPVAAPGFTLEDAGGADMRVVPLAGARLHSAAASDAGGAEPPRATERTAP